MTTLSRFIASAGAANLSDGIAVVAWGWVASQLTRDPLIIALVPVALKSPWFVFSLPAGIVVDRLDRRRIILWADLLRIMAFAVAGAAVWMALPLSAPPLRGTDHPGTLAILSLAAISVGMAEVLRDNAAQTMLPALVDSADLERANGRLWSVEMVANNLIGTALAGVLLGLSLAAPFAVNVAALGLAAALVAGLSGDFHPRRAERQGWRTDLAEGLRYLLREPTLRRMALLTGFTNFAFEAGFVVMVLVVQEKLHLGPWALSIILASGAAGGVLAGFTSHRIIARWSRARVMQASMLLFLAFPLGVLLAWPGGIAGLAILTLGFFISEYFGILWNTISVSYRQRTIPRALLGRVNSAYRLFALGMVPLGMLTGGALMRWATPVVGRDAALDLPFWMGLIVSGGATVAFWRFLGRAFQSG